MFSPQVKEVHCFANIKKAVCIVLEAELLASVIEVGFNQEIWTKSRLLTRICTSPPKSLLPFWPATVRDSCNLAGKFHSSVWGYPSIVISTRPIWIHH